MAHDAAPTAGLIGRDIGGCRLHRLIGRGAHGALYGAIDARDGMPRAVKLLELATGGNAERAEMARRFEQEARVLTALRHPGIVRCHRAGVQDDQAYLVMELLPGSDLRRYTRADRLLPVPEVLRIAAEVADALAHVHAHGVVHRDLKPANVMVDWPSRRVVLTDFGIARLDDVQRTRTGVVLGTPIYMAPELLAGSDPTAAVDLYALGVLLFELLSGKPPFTADGLGELLRQVAQVAAPPLASVAGPVPAGLAALVASLLAKSPAQRPGDASAVARLLADQCHAAGGRLHPMAEEAGKIRDHPRD